MTQANDDAAAAGHPPAGGPVRAPVPPQPGGAPGYPQQPQYGQPGQPQPGQPSYGQAQPGQPSYGQAQPGQAQPGQPQYGQPSYGQPQYGSAPGYPPYYGPPPPHGWRPPPMPLSPDGRPLADFGTRLLAHLIDGAILTGIAMIVFVPVLAFFMINTMPDLTDSTQTYPNGPEPGAVFGEFFVTFLLLELGLIVFLLAVYYVYYVEMMFRSGQTIGKKLMKIRVIPLEPAATMTRAMAAKRYLVEFPGGIVVPFFTYLDGLWQLWDKPYQQTLHDKFAKTVVIKVAP